MGLEGSNGRFPVPPTMPYLTSPSPLRGVRNPLSNLWSLRTYTVSLVQIGVDIVTHGTFAFQWWQPFGKFVRPQVQPVDWRRWTRDRIGRWRIALVEGRKRPVMDPRPCEEGVWKRLPLLVPRPPLARQHMSGHMVAFPPCIRSNVPSRVVSIATAHRLLNRPTLP